MQYSAASPALKGSAKTILTTPFAECWPLKADGLKQKGTAF